MELRKTNKKIKRQCWIPLLFYLLPYDLLEYIKLFVVPIPYTLRPRSHRNPKIE